MNYYPEQLEQIAKYCRALSSVEPNDEAKIVLGQRLPIVDSEDDQQTPLGYLIDEIGGAWSFDPLPGTDA